MRKEDLNQTNDNWTDDNFIRQKLEEAFGYSDEQLIKEFDQAAEKAAQCPELGLTPPEGEFQKIMDRIEREKKAERKTIRIKRVLRPLLVAALLGSVILGSGIGVTGDRGFEYGIQERGNNEVVFKNVEDIDEQGKLEQIYKEMEEELGITAIEFYYIPKGMLFKEATLNHNRAKLEFMYEDNYLYFYQVLHNTENSANYKSDRKFCKEVYNRYLDCHISVYKNELEQGLTEFGAQFTDEKAYYYLFGIIDEDEFMKIVEYIKYYEN